MTLTHRRLDHSAQLTLCSLETVRFAAGLWISRATYEQRHTTDLQSYFPKHIMTEPAGMELHAN